MLLVKYLATLQENLFAYFFEKSQLKSHNSCLSNYYNYLSLSKSLVIVFVNLSYISVWIAISWLKVICKSVKNVILVGLSVMLI